MQGLAHAFEDGIDTEPYVIKGDLQPVKPEECEEADVGFNRCLLVNNMWIQRRGRDDRHTSDIVNVMNAGEAR